MAPALILQALIAIKNRVILIASGFSLFRTGTLPSPCAARKTTENRGNLSPSNWPTGHRHPKMFEMPLFATASVLLSYLLGCLNAGYYYGRRVHRQDIRLAGSGTAGGHGSGSFAGPGKWCTVCRCRGLGPHLAGSVGVSRRKGDRQRLGLAAVAGALAARIDGGRLRPAQEHWTIIEPRRHCRLLGGRSRLCASVRCRASRGHGRAGTAAYHQPPTKAQRCRSP